MPDFTLTIGGQNVAGAARPIPVIDPSSFVISGVVVGVGRRVF